MGKSSLLRYLQDVLPAEGYTPVFFELGERPLDELLDDLAQQIIEQTGLDRPLPESSNDFRSYFLPEVDQALGESRLVLLLDDMDKLPGDHGFWKVVPFLTGDSPPALIYTSSYAPQQLPSKLKSVVRAMSVQGVGPLTGAEAEALLAGGGERIELTEAAVERIMAWCGGHPYCLQLVGQALWQRGDEPGVVEPGVVAEVVEGLAASGEGPLALLWEGLDVAEQLYTAVLAQQSQPLAALESKAVAEVIQAQAFRLRPHKVDWSVDDLVARGLLQGVEDEAYGLVPPLFHAWVRQFKPVGLVKAHLDHLLNPEIDGVFEEGQALMAQAQPEAAAVLFRQVVSKVPYHVGAQVALGASLLAVGSVETAVKHLERAYKLDVAEAQKPLGEALVVLAEVRLQADARNEALSACDQFNDLDLVDDDLQARVRVVETAVWNQRGDMALQRGLIDKALLAYENAGNTEKIAQLQTSPKRATRPKTAEFRASQRPTESISQLEAQANTLLQAEIWSEAAVVYEKLLGITQDASQRNSYQKALARCLEEIELARYFDEGVKALDNQNWLLARMSFTHVITRRKNYTRYGEKAVALLEQTTKNRPPTTPLIEFSSDTLDKTVRLGTASEAQTAQLSQESQTRPFAPQGEEPPQEEVAEKMTIDDIDPALLDTVNGYEQLERLGKGAVKQAVYSHDGKVLALATALGIYLYQTQPLAEIRFLESVSPVQAVAFSPDDKLLASGSWQHRVQLWQVEDGEFVAELRSHDSAIYALAFSPDGQTLASADENGVIVIWELENRRFLHMWEAHRGFISSLTFSPDGSNLLSGSEDKHFCLWQVDDEMSLVYLQKHVKGVVKAAFSPDGRRFFSASRDGTLNAWQMNATGWLRLRRSGTKVSQVFSQTGQYQQINDLAFSADGKLMATASSDHVVRLWSSDKGELLHEFTGHHSPVLTVAFAPDGRTLVSTTDSQVQFWDVAARVAGPTLEGHMGPLQSLVVSDDGQLLATADHARILVYSLPEFSLQHVLIGHLSHIYRLAFAPNSKLLASASIDRTVRLWDAAAGTMTHTLAEHEGAVVDVCFAPDGQYLASASEAQTIRIWRVADGEWVQTLPGHRDAVSSVCFNSSGQLLASGSSDRRIHLWHLAEEVLQTTFSGHKGIIWQLAFTADDGLLASAALDHTVRLWRVEDGTLLHVLGSHNGPVWSMQFARDEQWLITGAGDHNIRFWHVESGLLLRTLEGHTASVSSVALLPDGSRIVSAAADGTIRVWGVGE
ncbi:MAG: hypothetical protein H6658_19660 [Ardenticatenaceae bacterium]|nr:hypothetical protein [Ardenticatenaceae bacterium]